MFRVAGNGKTGPKFFFSFGGILKDKSPYGRIILKRRAVPWLRRLVAGLSTLRLGVNLGFVVALRQVFVEVEVSIRKVLRPATSTQVFLGFPVSTSEC